VRLRFVVVAFVARRPVVTKLVEVALVADRLLNMPVTALSALAKKLVDVAFVPVRLVKTPVTAERAVAKRLVEVPLVAEKLVAVALLNVCPPVQVLAWAVLRVTEPEVAVLDTERDPSGERTVVVAEDMPKEEVAMDVTTPLAAMRRPFKFPTARFVVVAFPATRLVVVAYVMERFVVEVAMTDGKQFASVGPQGWVAVPGSVVSPGEKGVVRAAARAERGRRDAKSIPNSKDVAIEGRLMLITLELYHD